MINKYLEIALNKAFTEAQERGHAFLTVEHLLLAILQVEGGRNIIEGVGGNIPRILKKLKIYLETIEKSPDKSLAPMQTMSFQRILQTAIAHLHSAEKKELDVGDVLAAIFQEEDCQARYILEQEGILRVDVLEYISHSSPYFSADGATEDEKIHWSREDSSFYTRQKNSSGSHNEKLIQKYTTNMCKLAAQGEYDVLIGREKEIERTIEILARRNKNNPIHVGDPGTGKTAIAQGLAQKLSTGDIPHVLKDYTLYSLEIATLISGAKFRGDFEERLRGVFNALEEQKAIVFIDEIHTIVGTGSVSSGSLDASNLLKPFLTRGRTRVLGSTTFEEYRQFFEKDRALSRRFQKIEIYESSVQETVKILKGIRNRYEAYHKVQYSDKALEAMAELSNRYIGERYLPDKAIDVLDELGAWTSIHRPHKILINAVDVEKQISKITKTPIGKADGGGEKNRREELKNLQKKLDQIVFAQEAATARIVAAVQRHRAGLANSKKPVGSFLFVGPTGVGKTELARALAKELSYELLRFDMSEYMEKHSISRFLGSPPGYVGFDQGAMLTDSIRKFPNSVLLLDEIEKAHPDIFNALLQIMDHATITDSSGRKADFRNVILIMTSNAGSHDMHLLPIGFADEKKTFGDPMREIKNLFSPEFRNRLDDIVVFQGLSQPTIEKVALKFIAELQEQLKPKRIDLQVSVNAVRYFAHRGYQPQFGARPMERFVQEKLRDAVVQEILFGKLLSGGTFLVDADIKGDEENWQLKFTVKPLPVLSKQKPKKKK